MSVTLGINALHAGASAALLVDGVPVAAMAEERLNRVKYHAGFPALAIRRCLDMAGLDFSDVDHVAVGREPAANRREKIEFVLRHPTRLLNFAKIRKARDRLDSLAEWMARECGVDEGALRFEEHRVEHHLAHTASAYFASPWERAAGFTIDGSGDFVTCMMSECVGSSIEVKRRLFVPHSLGSLYTMVCEFIGYPRYGDEGKVMGLAPYGRDTHAELFADVMELTDEGIRLNPDYFMPFGSHQGLSIDDDGRMSVLRHYSERMERELGPARQPGEPIGQREEDLAFGLQAAFERGCMHLLGLLHDLVPEDRVVMAGGCTLNSVANGKIAEQTAFRHSFVQPAAGDDGLALGAALHLAHSVLGEGERWVMRSAALGPEFSEEEIRRELERAGVAHRRLERGPLLKEVAQRIADGAVLGWFQGRMEWGPRALGHRSILAHPGLPGMKDTLNARIKHREPFRPFAPSVLAERQDEIFVRSVPSPFMMHVHEIRPEWRERLSAVTHVDGTGRLQTVEREGSPLYHELISTFGELTGIPVLLNTSFNENEPIVCEPAEAIDCFRRTRMDALAIGPFLCVKDGGDS